MLATLINKELRAIILSPKFTGTFAICSLLIILSIFTGVREYKTMVSRYEAASEMVEQELRQSTSWGRMSTKVYREPDPMHIFVSGVDYNIGRWSNVTERNSAKLKNSAYSDDPIYAVFRFVDFVFIVQFVLTLFAILLTYNTVCGEREDGTLQLVFSNAVSRAKYLIAKAIGAWLGLVVPICIPILIGLMIIMLYKIPLTFDHWFKIFLLLWLSLLLFTFFILLGIFISSITKRPSVSFLVSLIVWVLFVMMVPRAGVMAAGTIANVPRIAEVEGRISGYAKNRWEQFFKGMETGWNDYENSKSTDSAVSDEALWAMMEKQDSAHKVVEKEIDEYDIKLHEDLRQRKTQQENMAFTLSRLSPASAYQLGAMSLAGNNIDVKSRYEEAINNYRHQFYQFVEQKQEETGDDGRIMIAFTIEDDGTQDMAMNGGGRSKELLDVDQIPRFVAPSVSLAETISPVLLDFGLIILYSLLVFVGAFIAFIRYDVR